MESGLQLSKLPPLRSCVNNFPCRPESAFERPTESTDLWRTIYRGSGSTNRPLWSCRRYFKLVIGSGDPNISFTSMALVSATNVQWRGLPQGNDDMQIICITGDQNSSVPLRAFWLASLIFFGASRCDCWSDQFV